MSLVSFHQTAGSVSGLSIYDASPEWELSPPAESSGLVHPRLTTEEGSGSWLIFNRTNHLWGTVLRSGDSPYNDCLPPSEAFLLEAFRSGEALRGVIETLYDRTEDQFLNPFQAILGDLSDNRLYRFTGSFQSDHEQLDSAPQYLRDDHSPAETEVPDELRVSPNQDTDRTKEILQQASGDETLRDHLAEDGMRSPRFVTVFSFTNESLELCYTEEFPPGSDWEEFTLPAGTAESP